MTATSLRLLRDMILVRPLLPRTGLVIVPDTTEGRTAFEAGEYRDSFEGIVIATGPGDVLLHGKCDGCGNERDLIPFERLGTEHSGSSFGLCRRCGGVRWTLVSQGRTVLNTKVGDRILCPRRAGAEVVLDGERYLCFHEEQHALAILEEAA